MITWNWIKNKKPCDISIKKRMESDTLIVYGKTLEISYLNKTGARILDLSNGIRTLDDISRKLLEIYDVEEEELNFDIITIVRDLQWKRILKLED